MSLPRLAPEQVQVWIAGLGADAEQLRACEALLSADELERALRFRLPELRRRYGVAHAILRRLLAAQLGADAASLRLVTGPHGKPALRDQPQLCFNLSHAGDRAMFALAWQRDVGVDLEPVSPDTEVDAVARHVFSPEECDALAELPGAERREAFFRIWTRKEAYIKALGLGLAYPTQSFAVSGRRQDGDALLLDRSLPQAKQLWRVAEIAAPTGHCAALAAAGRDWSAVMAPGMLDAATRF
ncbi:MAG: hypothetical protein RJA36_3646 [Pseudomonadota bacterium]|jgi:4'-phosphopantetheinyl transferase